MVSQCCCSAAPRAQAGNLALCSAMQTDQFGYVLAQVLTLHTLTQCRHPFQCCSKGSAHPEFYTAFTVKIMLMLTFANYLIVSLSAKTSSLECKMDFSTAHVLSGEQHAQVFWKSSPHSVAGLYTPCKKHLYNTIAKKENVTRLRTKVIHLRCRTSCKSQVNFVMT